LIHNLPVSICEPEFVEHDIWFLNTQARTYCHECSAERSNLYLEQVKRIRELFSLVPETMRSKLSWEGPR